MHRQPKPTLRFGFATGDGYQVACPEFAGGSRPPGAEVARIMGEIFAAHAGFRTDRTHGTLGGDNALMRDDYEFSLELDNPVTLGPGISYIFVDLPSDAWRYSWLVSAAGIESSAWVTSPVP